MYSMFCAPCPQALEARNEAAEDILWWCRHGVLHDAFCLNHYGDVEQRARTQQTIKRVFGTGHRGDWRLDERPNYNVHYSPSTTSAGSSCINGGSISMNRRVERPARRFPKRERLTNPRISATGSGGIWYARVQPFNHRETYDRPFWSAASLHGLLTGVVRGMEISSLSSSAGNCRNRSTTWRECTWEGYAAEDWNFLEYEFSCLLCFNPMTMTYTVHSIIHSTAYIACTAERKQIPCTTQ